MGINADALIAMMQANIACQQQNALAQMNVAHLRNAYQSQAANQQALCQFASQFPGGVQYTPARRAMSPNCRNCGAPVSHAHPLQNYRGPDRCSYCLSEQ